MFIIINFNCVLYSYKYFKILNNIHFIGIPALPVRVPVFCYIGSDYGPIFVVCRYYKQWLEKIRLQLSNEDQGIYMVPSSAVL